MIEIYAFLGMFAIQVVAMSVLFPTRLAHFARAKDAEYPDEVFATLYHNLGIDVNKATLPDLSGRPNFLVPDGAQPMRELVG